MSDGCIQNVVVFIIQSNKIWFSSPYDKAKKHDVSKLLCAFVFACVFYSLNVGLLFCFCVFTLNIIMLRFKRKLEKSQIIIGQNWWVFKGVTPFSTPTSTDNGSRGCDYTKNHVSFKISCKLSDVEYFESNYGIIRW